MTRKMYVKSLRCYISLCRSPIKLIFIKVYVLAYLPEIMMYSQFHINQLSGFDSVRGRIFQFRLVAVNTVLYVQLEMGDWCLSGCQNECHQTVFKPLLLLQLLSDCYESWHICSMCPYRTNFATDFQIFALKLLDEFFKFRIEAANRLGQDGTKRIKTADFESALLPYVSLKKRTYAIFEFYFMLQFRPYHRNRNVILHQFVKFHPNPRRTYDVI